MTTGQVPEYWIFDEFSNGVLDLAKAFNGLRAGSALANVANVSVSNCTIVIDSRGRHTWVLVQLECGHSTWRVAEYPIRNGPIERDVTGLCPGCKAFGERYANVLNAEPLWANTLLRGARETDDDEPWMVWRVKLPP